MTRKVAFGDPTSRNESKIVNKNNAANVAKIVLKYERRAMGNL